MAKTKVAIIGSGNIGTDLMIKIMRLSDVLEMGVIVGIDPQSDGLQRAARLGVAITADGIDGLIAMPEFADIEIVFDATSAGAHKRNNEVLQAHGKRVIDLTPAAIGPCVIPPVNGESCLDAAARKGGLFPEATVGRRRKYHVPDGVAASAETMLADAKWQKISWRRGTRGKLSGLFAAHRVRVADGHKHRMAGGRVQAMPGEEEVWLVGERRTSGEQKCYLSNLPADTPLKTLAGAIKARWICEQAHQQLKEEHGLDHFEGRSWTGLHRHCVMAMIAFAFLQSRRLKAAGRKKRVTGPPPQPSMPAVRQAILDLFARPPLRRCPHCDKRIAEPALQHLPKWCQQGLPAILASRRLLPV